jgi:hypothetical protein
MTINQETMILAHLKAGGSITAVEALQEYGCFRLAARIKDLRDAGHHINTVIETLPNKKRIARYALINQVK